MNQPLSQNHVEMTGSACVHGFICFLYFNHFTTLYQLQSYDKRQDENSGEQKGLLSWLI
jgi:hypothetical protein